LLCCGTIQIEHITMLLFCLPGNMGRETGQLDLMPK